MKVRLTTNITLFTTVFLMTFAAGQALAGGLIDTSYEGGWAEANFTDKDSTQLSRNPWWDPTAGPVLYFADSEDGCEWNLVQDAGIINGAFADDGKFTGDYEMDIRVILDREWLVEEKECDETTFAEAYGDPENLKEATYDWYAIDKANNIWYMGEDTWDFEEESDEGSFAAGCNGAEPGIVILGGMPSKGTFYQQEYYEDEAEDWGKVLNYVELEDVMCMKTKEWTPLEPGEVEHKYYCDGELVLIEELKGKTKDVEIFEGSYVIPSVPPAESPECDLD